MGLLRWLYGGGDGGFGVGEDVGDVEGAVGFVGGDGEGEAGEGGAVECGGGGGGFDGGRV